MPSILFRSQKANIIIGSSVVTALLMLMGFLMRSQLGFGALFTILMLVLNGAAMSYNVNCLEYGGCDLWSTILTIFILLGLLGSLGGAIWMILGKKNDVAEAPTPAESAAAEANGAEGFFGWMRRRRHCKCCGSACPCRHGGKCLCLSCKCGGNPCRCGGRGW